MSIKISLLANDATSDPVKSLDLIIMSNEDGGGGFDVSKRITIDELATFLGISSISIPNDVIAIGNAAGDGIEASTGKAGGVAGDTAPLYLAHKDQHTLTGYALYQDSGGNTQLNTASGTTGVISVSNSPIIRFRDGAKSGVDLAVGASTDVVSIGIATTAAESGARQHVRGLSDDNTTNTATFSSQNGGTNHAFRIDGADFVFLKTGTGVNNISTDGTAAANSDNNLMTEKAIVTLISGDTQIIGGVTLSSSSNTNILNGTYVILADTTTVTSVTSGIGQDSNWTLEITQAGITNQKGVVTFTGNLEKDGGGGANYDVAIFKNGSIVSESEQVDQKLESDGKGQSVTAMAIIEFSTNDTFDIRVSGNGTANDIFCGGGSLYIQ